MQPAESHLCEKSFMLWGTKKALALKKFYRVLAAPGGSGVFRKPNYSVSALVSTLGSESPAPADDLILLQLHGL